VAAITGYLKICIQITAVKDKSIQIEQDEVGLTEGDAKDIWMPSQVQQKFMNINLMFF